MKANQVYEEVTATIIRQLEAGASAAEWRAPWHGLSDVPRNAVTGAAYRGSNVVTLWSAELRHNYTSPLWATYKQWAEVGAQVRKGEHADYGVKWVTKKARDDEGRSPLVPVGFAVFNAAQVDGWEAPVVNTDPVQTIAQAEAFYASVGADVTYHDRDGAYYQPSRDRIFVPAIQHFESAERYYATLGHEHVHWTGAKSRLDREYGSFGDERYAREELIAELGAAFLGATLGIEVEPREDHAQYLDSWIRALRSDHKALFTAASAAQRAVDYLHAFNTLEVAA